MTTKQCPSCGSKTVSELRSISKKKCLDCGLEYDWPLDEGQESLDASARSKRLANAVQRLNDSRPEREKRAADTAGKTFDDRGLIVGVNRDR